MNFLLRTFTHHVSRILQAKNPRRSLAKHLQSSSTTFLPLLTYMTGKPPITRIQAILDLSNRIFQDGSLITTLKITNDLDPGMTNVCNFVAGNARDTRKVSNGQISGLTIDLLRLEMLAQARVFTMCPSGINTQDSLDTHYTQTQRHCNRDRMQVQVRVSL